MAKRHVATANAVASPGLPQLSVQADASSFVARIELKAAFEKALWWIRMDSTTLLLEIKWLCFHTPVQELFLRTMETVPCSLFTNTG
jgi:hypothetical protein